MSFVKGYSQGVVILRTVASSTGICNMSRFSVKPFVGTKYNITPHVFHNLSIRLEDHLGILLLDIFSVVP